MAIDIESPGADAAELKAAIIALLAAGNISIEKLVLSSGATAFEFKADSGRVSTVPVAYLRPTAATSAMVLDLMPSGTTQPSNELSTGTCWIDIVNRDLITTPASEWQVARMAIKWDGTVYMGASSSSGSTPGQTRLIGSSFAYREVTPGMALETNRFEVQSGGTIIAGNGSWFALYATLGLWLTDKHLALKDTVPIRWYDSATGLTAYDTGVVRSSAGVVEANNGTLGTYRDFKARNFITTGQVKLASFTVATLPSVSSPGAGSQIYVTDEAGGAVVAFSDGTNWRRVTDRAIVS